MTKIHNETAELIDYRIPVDNACDESQLSEYISKLKPHQNILHPYACVKEGKSLWLVYKVTAKGATLRTYILDKPKTPRLSHILFHSNRLNPIQTLLQLIDGYEFLLNNHMLTNQSNINPDYIWIEPGEKAFVINTIESMTNEKMLSTTFWSPEMLSKYNHAAFYDDAPEGQHASVNNLASKLKRYDTRPSTISTVYSLGLVLYFIVAKREPFEGTRVNVYEKPHMHCINDERMKQYILTAIDPDARERPTLQQYREYLLDSHLSACVIS